MPSVLAVLALLHLYGNLCLIPRDSAPALASLAPKRTLVHCARWRPPGLGRHGSRHVNLARCTLHRCLRSSGASLVRPPPREVLVSFTSQGLAPHEAWPLARALSR